MRIILGKKSCKSYDCGYNPEKEGFPVCLETTEIYESKWLTLYSDKVRMLKNNESRCGVSMFGLLYAMQFYMK